MVQRLAKCRFLKVLLAINFEEFYIYLSECMLSIFFELFEVELVFYAGTKCTSIFTIQLKKIEWIFIYIFEWIKYTFYSVVVPVASHLCMLAALIPIIGWLTI